MIAWRSQARPFGKITGSSFGDGQIGSDGTDAVR
jgi:hypothetical protein